MRSVGSSTQGVGAPSVESTAARAVQRAITLIEAGLWDQGEHACADAILLNPDNAVVREMLASCLALRGQEREALVEYQRAIACDPSYNVAWNNMGFLLERLGRIRDAELIYRTAASLPPPDARSHHNLGNCLVNQGKWQDAIEAYRAALTCDPSLLDVKWNLEQALEHERVASQSEHRDYNAEATAAAHYLNGLSHHQRGDWEPAINEYKAALSFDPMHAFSRENLAKALLAGNAVSEAVAEIALLLADYPRNASAHRLLGYCCSKLGDVHRAVDELQKALELDPKWDGDSAVPMMVGMLRVIKSHKESVSPDRA